VLQINQRFDKHCIFHLQDDYVVVGRFRRLYIGQTVGDELDFVVLIGGTEERAAPSNTTRHLLTKD
jgi:hypothetical protein